MDIIILIIVVATNLLLGVIAIRHSVKKVNVIFLLIILSVILWSIFNYLGDYFANIFINERLSTIYTRLTYSASCAIAASFFYFVLIFPDRKKKIAKAIVYSLITSSILVIFLSFTKLIVKEVEVINSTVHVNTGPLFFIFIIYFTVWMLLAFITLIKKYVKSEGISRLQIQYLFLGTFLSSLFASLTNVVIPSLTGDFSISRYGPYFMIFFISFSAYAIIKHRLMDIRIIIRKSVVYFGALVTVMLIGLGIMRFPGRWSCLSALSCLILLKIHT